MEWDINNKMRILFCTGEGIGNVLQCIPVLRTIKEVLGYKVDMWHAFGQFKVGNVIPYINKFFAGGEIKHANFKEYGGVVSTFWAKNYLRTLPNMPMMAGIYPLSMTRSEVDTYMQIARDMGVKEEDLIWHGNCTYLIKKATKFDVVIADGYNRHGAANWAIKSYPYYEALVTLIKEAGFSVASIGAPQEYVSGTVDRTGLELKHSFGAIKQAKLLIANDTGMYHAANALETPNVVIFTASSVAKNYDERFHKYSTIVAREDLTCRIKCQSNRRWNKDCKRWECKNIRPSVVFKKAMEILNGQPS